MLGYRRDITSVINKQLHLFDICINQLVYRLDISFANVYANITQISNQFLSPSYVNDVSQTFYEIITQQPYKFNMSNITINSSSIILNWNYDSIIAKHSNNNIAKLANISDYAQNLPFIDEIIIEISQNNIWMPMVTLTISGDYNVNNFKSYTLQRSIISNNTSNNMPFSIRVYGKNYSTDYPTIETRALVFENLNFLDAYHPSKPLYIDSSASYVSNVNNIILTYFNTLSDISNALSNAYLNNYIIDYSLNDTLASASLVNIQNNISLSSNFSSIINSSSNFNITLTNLMSGANYNHRVKVRNNLSNIYSDYSSINTSKYTLLPSDNVIGTFIDMSINSQCYKYVSTSSLDNSSILYFNIANSSHSFKFSDSSSQVFQITHPYFANQQLENYRYGYGKYVDNCFNLVTINLNINNVEKHVINYGGYNTSANSYNYSKTDSSNNFILNNTNTNIEDIYSDPSNSGFRLKGYLLLKDEITNANIVNYFGDPSTSPYIMNFNYIRSASVNNSFSIYKTYNIYVDELSSSPTISNNNNTLVIQDVVYNMSVASVKYFKLALTRTYSNINSTYKYIVGNRIIADFSYLNTNTNTTLISFTNENITLAQSDICANGVYNYDLCYNIAYYQQVKNDYSFNLLEKVYNMYGDTSTNISLMTKPFCDYNSFNKSNNIIISSKLDLSALHVYEISNIELMGSDLNNIVLKPYINHSNPILPCTLLYLDSCFNNVFASYPKSIDFSYNNNSNLDVSYNTYGNISYDLNGTLINNNQGYKWIVFKIFKANDVSNSYLFNDISYNISTTTDGNNIKYLPLKTMLINSGLFLNSIVNNIFDITDTSALMFGHATTINSNKRYFNIKQNFNGLGGIWTENSNSNNISYSNTANSKIFGSNVYAEGIYCPINNLNDDLTIYIGIKELVI